MFSLLFINGDNESAGDGLDLVSDDDVHEENLTRIIDWEAKITFFYRKPVFHSSMLCSFSIQLTFQEYNLKFHVSISLLCAVMIKKSD